MPTTVPRSLTQNGETLYLIIVQQEPGPPEGNSWFGDVQSIFMPAAAHAAKLNEWCTSRRAISWAIGLAVVVGFGTCPGFGVDDPHDRLFDLPGLLMLNGVKNMI